MGQPICKTHHDGVDASMNSVAEKASEDPGADDVGNDGAEEDESLSNDNDATPFMNATNNPRILQSESWRKHTNRELIEKFVHLFSSHYPERLSKVLVVTGKGKNFYYKTIVRGRFAMKKLIGSPETRNKVIFIRNTFELTEYVDENQLTSIVGGFTQIGPGAFESSR